MEAKADIATVLYLYLYICLLVSILIPRQSTFFKELNKTKALLEAAEQSLEAKSLGVNAAIANTGTVASEDADKPVPERGLETQLTLKPQSSQQVTIV